MESCSRCRISDWARLRGALNLSQPQLAELLGVGVRTIKRLEQARGHRCLSRPAVKLLRFWLQDPEMQARLKAANYPHPWPEDAG